jgi:hypothetical protein
MMITGSLYGKAASRSDTSGNSICTIVNACVLTRDLVSTCDRSESVIPGTSAQGKDICIEMKGLLPLIAKGRNCRTRAGH